MYHHTLKYVYNVMTLDITFVLPHFRLISMMAVPTICRR